MPSRHSLPHSQPAVAPGALLARSVGLGESASGAARPLTRRPKMDPSGSLAPRYFCLTHPRSPSRRDMVAAERRSGDSRCRTCSGLHVACSLTSSLLSSHSLLFFSFLFFFFLLIFFYFLLLLFSRASSTPLSRRLSIPQLSRQHPRPPFRPAASWNPSISLHQGVSGLSPRTKRIRRPWLPGAQRVDAVIPSFRPSVIPGSSFRQPCLIDHVPR
jgi:hypothetical protein